MRSQLHTGTSEWWFGVFGHPETLQPGLDPLQFQADPVCSDFRVRRIRRGGGGLPLFFGLRSDEARCRGGMPKRDVDPTNDFSHSTDKAAVSLGFWILIWLVGACHGHLKQPARWHIRITVPSHAEGGWFDPFLGFRIF